MSTDASIKIVVTVQGGVVQLVERSTESSAYSSVPVIIQVTDLDGDNGDEIVEYIV